MSVPVSAASVGSLDLVQDLARKMLEQRAQLTDRVMYDKLLVDVLYRYAEAERGLRQLHEQKNRFLGMAAHDLRNPLSALRGMAELMLETELDGDQRTEMMREMHKAANDMLRLVNDLLDVAVIESGKLDVRLRPTDLSHLAEARVKLMIPLARTKDIAIVTDAPEGMRCALDPDRCTQVVDNLLTNAVKFSPSGTSVFVTVHRDGAVIALSVRDQGPGIAAEDRTRLFGTFEKLKARPTGGEKSTGLGLAIVKKIVDAHRGTIDVENAPDGGAIFTVRFPGESGS